MKKYILLGVVMSFFAISCQEEIKKEDTIEKNIFNAHLATQLKEMTAIDQYYAGAPKDQYEGDWDTWYVARDSVERMHQKVLIDIIAKHGYPGYDLVGKEGESNFWVMTQHCDFDPTWQQSVLLLLKAQVDKNNADANNYGYLVDRVRKNTGRPQLYGTQVDYDQDGQAFIKELENRDQVNERRAALGMEPLESYLNDITRSHFEMNKEHMLSKGIMKPKLYKIPNE